MQGPDSEASVSMGVAMRGAWQEVGACATGLTSNLELQTRPMKLLLCAMRTASLMDMEPCPLLRTVELEEEGDSFAPRSLQRRTGSGLALAHSLCVSGIGRTYN